MAFHAELLPEFPWHSLAPARARAAEHPDGPVDLTIGTPVDSVSDVVRAALADASDAHGYPDTLGTPELRAAIRNFLEQERGVAADTDVAILPTIGSKEMVGLLPSLLGLGADALVAFPSVAYPTYDVGARLAGCKTLCLDTEADPSTWPAGITMLWLNSPGNPDGHVLSVEQLQTIVAWARENRVVVASDECYANLCWGVAEAPSILDERVNGGDVSGLLLVYSLSKRSNLAGYRAAFLAGDPQLVAPIVELRRHLGFMMPGPVQRAMVAALEDSAHAQAQREVYAARRAILLDAVQAAGLVNDADSVAGLYLWVRWGGSDDVSGWDIVNACAELGIIVTPGDFYGDAGRKHVRMSLTASDEAIAAAAERLPQLAAALAI